MGDIISYYEKDLVGVMEYSNYDKESLYIFEFSNIHELKAIKLYYRNKEMIQVLFDKFYKNRKSLSGELVVKFPTIEIEYSCKFLSKNTKKENNKYNIIENDSKIWYKNKEWEESRIFYINTRYYIETNNKLIQKMVIDKFKVQA